MDNIIVKNIGFHNMMRAGFINDTTILDQTLTIVDSSLRHPVFQEAISPEVDSKGDAIILSNGFLNAKQGVTEIYNSLFNTSISIVGMI